ncbi:hypothetical protein H257_13149 [Aphanomyces astaci]|uniref:Importin N-terminal domain-containing protein n=1 Tax=Aphanomyces astaci TaxID=112090 RepID=W4FXP0_APHAT|nr:hypothetical protein H257_13149 [Aphanomyces astaci]ETV71721.1 hypothetical protein H257_13149 [Aphanomyces astaci]|eukprot:XP_009838909.1 hypothetical protein H257_13149 [Aphanomyces astaci]
MDDLSRLLEGTLSNDTARRESAEAHLTESLSSPGFALLLTQYLQAPLSLSLAQLAAVLLKKFVLAHWEETTGEDSTYVIGDAEKGQVRNLLVHSLDNLAHGTAPSHFGDSKFQTAYSLVLAELVKHDWPEKWPALVPGIIELMATHTDFALKFFSVATDHIASDHFVELVPLLFPHLERVFDSPSTPPRLQGRVVAIVQTCLAMLGMMSQSGESAQAGVVLQATVSPWIGRFVRALQSQPSQHRGLSIVVVRALTSFIVEWPKDMSTLVPSILPPVWQLLVSSVAAYEADVVLDGEGHDDDGYDSDGEPIGQAALTMELFDFVRGLVHAPTKKTRALVTASLHPLVHTMVAYMQITRAQLELWTDDPNQYVVDEDDDSLQHNVRNTGVDLLRELETTLGTSVLTASIQATHQRLTESSWRVQEAALLVMGALAEPLLMTRATSDAAPTGLDLPSFLTTLFDVMHAAESNIYLKARALWCASRFATVMTEAQLLAFIQVAISGLDPAQVIPVKLYACRALGTFVQHEKADAILPPFATTIVDRLLHLTVDATPETLHVVLETLALVVVVPGTPVQRVLTCVVPLWLRHLDDRMVHDVTVDILAALVADADAAPVVLTHVVPVLANVFNSLYVLQAIEVVELLVKQAAVAPLVVPVLLDPLLHILITTDDGSALQHGGDVLKWIVLYASPQLEHFSSPSTGASGVDGVMQVVAKLLSPDVSDSGAMGVGGLVTQVLLRLAPLLPVATVHQLLHAVSTRLASAQMPSLIQSLCTVYARLVHSFGVATIVDALESLGVCSFVLTTWIEHQGDFYGLYAIKVTLLALLKLLESQHPVVLALVVQGEMVQNHTSSTKRALRSANKAEPTSRQYTQVSFATKLVSILAMTYAQFEDEAEADDMDSSDEEESDDGDDSDEEVSATSVRPGGPSSIFAPSEDFLLSDMLDGGSEPDGDDEDEIEAAMDPLNDVDLKEQIVLVMRALNSTPSFVESVVPGLTATEKSIIQDMLS